MTFLARLRSAWPLFCWAVYLQGVGRLGDMAARGLECRDGRCE